MNHFTASLFLSPSALSYFHQQFIRIHYLVDNLCHPNAQLNISCSLPFQYLSPRLSSVNFFLFLSLPVVASLILSSPTSLYLSSFLFPSVRISFYLFFCVPDVDGLYWSLLSFLLSYLFISFQSSQIFLHTFFFSFAILDLFLLRM